MDEREKWKTVRDSYDPNSADSHLQWVETAYTAIYDARNDPDVIAYHAAHHVVLIIGLSEHHGFDISRASPPAQALPLPDTHPFVEAVQFFDNLVGICLRRLSAQVFENKLDRSLFVNRILAAEVWRNYLLALCRPANNWERRETSALGALRILSTVSQAEVVHQMHLIVPSSEKEKMKEGNWPPSGFTALYFEHRQEIETLCQKLYGRGVGGFSVQDSRPTYVEDQMRRWEQSAAALDRAMLPIDNELWEQAQRRAGHISLKAVNDEYDRLLETKLKPRSFLSRLFGS